MAVSISLQNMQNKLCAGSVTSPPLSPFPPPRDACSDIESSAKAILNGLQSILSKQLSLPHAQMATAMALQPGTAAQGLQQDSPAKQAMHSDQACNKGLLSRTGETFTDSTSRETAGVAADTLKQELLKRLQQLQVGH